MNAPSWRSRRGSTRLRVAAGEGARGHGLADHGEQAEREQTHGASLFCSQASGSASVRPRPTRDARRRCPSRARRRSHRPDQQPLRVSPAAGGRALEREAAARGLAVQRPRQRAVGSRRLGAHAPLLVRPTVRDDHAARHRVRPLEGVPCAARCVLSPLSPGQALGRGSSGGPFGHGPRPHGPVDLQAHVVVVGRRLVSWTTKTPSADAADHELLRVPRARAVGLGSSVASAPRRRAGAPFRVPLAGRAQPAHDTGSHAFATTASVEITSAAARTTPCGWG